METSSIYYVLTMHFKRLKIFQLPNSICIFTLEDDCNKNWIFCFPSAFWPLKIKILSIFILSFFTQKCKFLISCMLCLGQNVFKIFQLPNSIYIHIRRWLQQKLDFCFLSAFWPLKIKILSIFILSLFTQKCKFLISCMLCLGQNVDIYPSKRL